MVLGEPGDRVAKLVGEPGLLGNLGKDLRRGLLRLARGHQVEDAEFHCRLLSCCWPLRWTLSAVRVKRGPARRISES